MRLHIVPTPDGRLSCTVITDSRRLGEKFERELHQVYEQHQRVLLKVGPTCLLVLPEELSNKPAFLQVVARLVGSLRAEDVLSAHRP